MFIPLVYLYGPAVLLQLPCVMLLGVGCFTGCASVGSPCCGGGLFLSVRVLYCPAVLSHLQCMAPGLRNPLTVRFGAGLAPNMSCRASSIW